MPSNKVIAGQYVGSGGINIIRRTVLTTQPIGEADVSCQLLLSLPVRRANGAAPDSAASNVGFRIALRSLVDTSKFNQRLVGRAS